MDIAATMNTGARERFAGLLEQHRGIVLKVAGTYAWHPEDRADLAQEIAAQLWRAFPKYDGSRSFPTWMYRIALNVAISAVRGDGARRQQSIPLDEDLHEVGIEGADHEADQHLRLLRRCIERLEPLNRALLLLYLEDRSHREIAEVLGISESNVATKLGRLKQRLRDDIA